jgi:hypothetical protein
MTKIKIILVMSLTTLFLAACDSGLEENFETFL